MTLTDYKQPKMLFSSFELITLLQINACEILCRSARNPWLRDYSTKLVATEFNVQLISNLGYLLKIVLW